MTKIVRIFGGKNILSVPHSRWRKRILLFFENIFFRLWIAQQPSIAVAASKSLIIGAQVGAIPSALMEKDFLLRME